MERIEIKTDDKTFTQTQNDRKCYSYFFSNIHLHFHKNRNLICVKGSDINYSHIGMRLNGVDHESSDLSVRINSIHLLNGGIINYSVKPTTSEHRFLKKYNQICLLVHDSLPYRHASKEIALLPDSIYYLIPSDHR